MKLVSNNPAHTGWQAPEDLPENTDTHIDFHMSLQAYSALCRLANAYDQPTLEVTLNALPIILEDLLHLKEVSAVATTSGGHKIEFNHRKPMRASLRGV